GTRNHEQETWNKGNKAQGEQGPRGTRPKAKDPMSAKLARSARPRNTGLEVNTARKFIFRAINCRLSGYFQERTCTILEPDNNPFQEHPHGGRPGCSVFISLSEHQRFYPRPEQRPRSFCECICSRTGDGCGS